MNDEPEKRGFLFENLVLALNKLTIIKKITDRITSKKVFKDLPSTVQDDIKEIQDVAEVRKEE